ncbi:hypothetical protein FB451DRAFT_1179380 [Mycena latifolia]|nr:hypothetical protein FB451DRAFT_1179380 [Mycena latifolia]
MLEKLQQPSLISSLAEAKLQVIAAKETAKQFIDGTHLREISMNPLNQPSTLCIPFGQLRHQDLSSVSLPLDSDDVLNILESSPNPVVEHFCLQEAMTPPVAYHTSMFAVKSLQVLDIIKEEWVLQQFVKFLTLPTLQILGLPEIWFTPSMVDNIAAMTGWSSSCHQWKHTTKEGRTSVGPDLVGSWCTLAIGVCRQCTVCSFPSANKIGKFVLRPYFKFVTADL